jgi:hypothetical protein
MGHSTGTLQSAYGLELYYQRRYPDAAPRLSITILHGSGCRSCSFTGLPIR